MSIHRRHRRNSWDQYQAIHAKRIADYSPHFILEDGLIPDVTAEAVVWRGVLRCAAGVEIHVFKVQELSTRRDGRLMVRTMLYEYHVLQRRTEGERNLFRYDNAHQHPGHPDGHHRHDYDDEGAVKTRHLTDCGWMPGDWPTLGDVIEEAYDLWQGFRGA